MGWMGGVGWVLREQREARTRRRRSFHSNGRGERGYARHHPPTSPADDPFALALSCLRSRSGVRAHEMCQ